jgi:hypothetical protein
MTDTLLFLHVLSAAALFTGVVAFSAVALGARMEPGGMRLSLGLWHAGMAGVVLFGIALAIDIDGYQLWDGWILVALGLWLAAGYTGDKLAVAHKDAGEGFTVTPQVSRMHWITVLIVLLLLADMVWKPWV